MPIGNREDPFELSASIVNDNATLNVLGVTVTMKIQDAEDHVPHSSSTDGVFPGNISIQESGKPFLVLRRREFYKTRGASGSLSLDDLNAPAHGLLIWIEED